ncbi:MAG: CopG family transcriptional regulator [Actinomycetota bacterium]|nr:CopG family transcriptional regulator [Actinomycetota bacterium]
MNTEKVSLSLDSELLAEARRRSEGYSLSAYVNNGLHRQVLVDRQREFLADWESEYGPIPEEALAEMTALWPD